MGELSNRLAGMAAQRARDKGIDFEAALREIHEENRELRDQARYETVGRKVRHEKVGDITVLVIDSPEAKGGRNG
jgi:hypothetical protein